MCVCVCTISCETKRKKKRGKIEGERVDADTFTIDRNDFWLKIRWQATLLRSKRKVNNR